MDLQYILETLRAIKLELYRYRVAAVVVFMAVTAGVLTWGYVTPKSYTSKAVLYADQSSILGPLLRGQAEITELDRINEARELIESRSFLESVALESGLVEANQPEKVKTVVIGQFKEQVRLRVSNRNFLELTYTSGDPGQSFKVTSALLNHFIDRTIQKKRAESRSAFEFIDSQVDTYKRQLEDAEQKLKEFKSDNQDGTENNVRARIETLRADIENLKLEIQQSEAEVRLTREQLSREDPVRRVTVDPGRSAAERQLITLRQQMNELLLSYHERHPDVVTLKGQIADLQERIGNEGEDAREGTVTQVLENPVYENLKLQLAESTTNLTVQKNRLASLERLLEEAFQRSERVAENQARLSELTRDYDVTRNVYEDMLQRRERARLSMTLDVQGEGVSYRIQEPASYPTHWDGLQLYQVGLAGPFLGSGMVLGLLTLLVMFDQRVRSPRTLNLALPETIPLLASVPHYRSTWKERLLRKDVLGLLFVLGLFMMVYLGVLVFSVMGVTPERVIEKLLELVGAGASDGR